MREQDFEKVKVLGRQLVAIEDKLSHWQQQKRIVDAMIEKLKAEKEALFRKQKELLS